MLDLILGGAGCGKSCKMMKSIGEAAADEKKDVLVIVPDQFSAEYDKSLYDEIGIVLFNRVEVLSFLKVSREIFIRHGGRKGRHADDTVKNIMMFRALKNLSERGDLHFFNKQAGYASFIDSSLNIVRELMISGISPEALTAGAEKLGDSIRDKISDIAAIYTEYCRLLEEAGYEDGDGDIAKAAAIAKSTGYFGGRTIFIDAFKSFTADEIAMLNVMLSDSENVTLCLTTADRSMKKYSVFDTVNKTIRKLKKIAEANDVNVNEIFLDTPYRFEKAPELAYYSQNVFGYSQEKYNGENKAVRVYRSADPYGEGDFVCSEIKRLIMNEPEYSCDDIAVIARQKEQYASIMESAFERYGIPFYTDESHNAAHKALLIFVKTALSLASDKNVTCEDWLRYMKTGLLGLSDEEIGAAEEYCCKWSVTGEMWQNKFVGGEGTPEAEFAENIRKTVTEPVAKLKNACTDNDIHTICKAVFDFFEDANVNKSLKDMYYYPKTRDAAALAAVREVKQLWQLLCGLMETFSRALANAPVTLADFRDMFSAAAGRLKLSAPPQALDSVRFVAAHTARLDNVKAVFIIGANDGAFPYTAKQEGIINDRDRLSLEEAGIVLSGGSEDKLSEERFVAYSALSAPSDKLYITYAMSDIAGKPMYPSSVVNRAEVMFGRDVTLDYGKLGMLQFCTSPEAAYYQYVQNYRRDDEDSASLKEALTGIREYDNRLKRLRDIERAAGHGLLNGTGEKLFGKDIHFSASRFEDYNKCPFMYYCKMGLHIKPFDKIELDGRSRGNIIHHCLCKVLEARDKKTFISMDKAAIEAAVKTHLDAYRESEEVGGDYGKTKRFDAGYDRLKDTVTDILLRLQDEFSQNEFEPNSFEYVLGSSGSDKNSLVLTAKDDTKVYFEGKIDRVDDFSKDGTSYVRVVDYKSGEKKFKFADLAYGINMQMLLYLFALTDPDHNGKYKDSKPGGVLYMPSKDIESILERDSSDKPRALKNTYKMSGAVLADETVIKAMEEKCGGEYIPVKKADAAKEAYAVSEQGFENLRKYSYDLLEKTARKLHDGLIEARPLKEGEYVPCQYCDFKTICGNYPPNPSKVKKYDKKTGDAEIKKLIAPDSSADAAGTGNGEE